MGCGSKGGLDFGVPAPAKEYLDGGFGNTHPFFVQFRYGILWYQVPPAEF